VSQKINTNELEKINLYGEKERRSNSMKNYNPPILRRFFLSQQMDTNVHENIFLRRKGMKEMMNENYNPPYKKM